MKTPSLNLLLIGGPRHGEALQFVPRSKVRIGRLDRSVRGGRGNNNNLLIEDDCISSHHLLIASKSGKWTIQDLASTNGTYLNSTRLSPSAPCVLSHNDTVKLGASTSILVQLQEVRVVEETTGRGKPMKNKGSHNSAPIGMELRSTRGRAANRGGLAFENLEERDREVRGGRKNLQELPPEKDMRSVCVGEDEKHNMEENLVEEVESKKPRRGRPRRKGLQEAVKEVCIGGGGKVIKQEGLEDLREAHVGEGAVEDKGILVEENLESEAAYEESVKGGLTVGDSEKECGEASIRDVEGKSRGGGLAKFDWETGTLEDWFDYMEDHWPRQIIQATEEMVEEMRRKVERVNAYVMEQKRERGVEIVA